MWMFHEIKVYTQTSRVSYRKMVRNMNKEEVVKLMLDSINEDNRSFCVQSGMPDGEIEIQVKQSQPALAIITRNMYDRMKDAGVIV